jgi:hypothetical protein
MCVVEPEVLVVDIVIHGAIGWGGDKVDIFGEGFLVGIEEFNKEFAGLVDMSPVHLDFHRCRMEFLFTFANGDAVRDKVGFKIRGFLLEKAFTVSRRRRVGDIRLIKPTEATS